MADGSESLQPMLELALWIVTFIVVLGVILSLITSGEDVSKEVICRDSVALRSKAEFTAEAFGTEIAKFERMTPLMCEPQNVGTLEGTREEIKQQIAELSARCWWMYMEGKVANIFNLKEKDVSGCGVCYYFRIPDNLDGGNIHEISILNEMTLDKFNEIRRELKNTDDPIPQKIQEQEREPLILRQEDKEIVRFPHFISMQEMYNYLLTEQYNPLLLYGGGTKQYIGGIHEFDSDIIIRDPQRTNLRDLKDVPTGYLQDFTGTITQETQNKILDVGNKLLQQDSLLLVVVADEIYSHNRRDSRRLIENLHMNSADDKYDAILITIDVTNGQIRIHTGGDLEIKVLEHELIMMIQQFNKIHETPQLNQELKNLIQNLEQQLITQSVTRTQDRIQIPQGTYYDYISNQQTKPVIIDQIQAGRTYAITYTSESDVQSFWDGIKDSPGAAIVSGAGVGVATIAVTIAVLTAPASITAMGIFAAIKTTAALTSLSIAGASYLTFSAQDQSLASGIQALQGKLGSGEPKNAILITTSLGTDNVCDEIN